MATKATQATHDLVTLKVQLREAKAVLGKLGDFEKLFDQFCQPLRKAVEQLHGGRWQPGGTLVNVVVLEADGLRLQLSEMEGLVLPRYRDPLAKLLRTSLRT